LVAVACFLLGQAKDLSTPPPIITVRTDAEETASAHNPTSHNKKRTQCPSDIDKHPESTYDLVRTDVKL